MTARDLEVVQAKLLPEAKLIELESIINEDDVDDDNDTFQVYAGELRELLRVYRLAHQPPAARSPVQAYLDAPPGERILAFHATAVEQENQQLRQALEEKVPAHVAARQLLGFYYELAGMPDMAAEVRSDGWESGTGFGPGSERELIQVMAALVTSVRTEVAALSSAPVAPVGEPLAEAEARVMQDYQWGNLTRLGVANHLRRAGFNLRVATDKANALPIETAPVAPVGEGLREALQEWANEPCSTAGPEDYEGGCCRACRTSTALQNDRGE